MGRTVFATSVGACAVAWEGSVVTRFELPEAAARPGDTTSVPPAVAAVIDRVHRHLAGDYQDFSDLTFAYDRVADFQQQVYRATLAVKAGQTKSYGQIAAAIGQPPAASRAVGTALGSNPWPLLIPCHRIVSANGKMTGFSSPGGVRMKLRLLALEGSELFAE